MKLNHLTDKCLHQDLQLLIKQERELLTKILFHLKEVDRRKLYSDYRCSSLFDYCLTILKYSEGQASRRVNACRLIAQLPSLSVPIENGSLKLSQLNQANQFFRDEGIKDAEIKQSILGKLENKTTRESEKILWELKCENSPRRINLVLKEETVFELKEVQALKAHSCPDLDSLLMAMSKMAKTIWNPIQLMKRRSQNSVTKRTITRQLKSNVWQNGMSQCRRCGSKYALQIDHIKPFALGGLTTPDNLQLLCRNCNQRKGYG